jgi:hypothetical protein
MERVVGVTVSGALIQSSDDESCNSNDDANIPSSSNMAEDPAGSLTPSLSGVMSSTSTTHPAIPSSSATVPMDTGNNLDMFHDQFNMGGDTTSGLDELFTGYHHNDLNSLFPNFDFGDESMSNAVF